MPLQCSLIKEIRNRDVVLLLDIPSIFCRVCFSFHLNQRFTCGIHFKLHKLDPLSLILHYLDVFDFTFELEIDALVAALDFIIYEAIDIDFQVTYDISFGCEQSNFLTKSLLISLVVPDFLKYQRDLISYLQPELELLLVHIAAGVFSVSFVNIYFI